MIRHQASHSYISAQWRLLKSLGVCVSGQDALQAEDFEPKASPSSSAKGGSQREAAEVGEEKQQSSPEEKQSKESQKIVFALF